jgi:hypothetical protein
MLMRRRRALMLALRKACMARNRRSRLRAPKFVSPCCPAAALGDDTFRQSSPRASGSSMSDLMRLTESTQTSPRRLEMPAWHAILGQRCQGAPRPRKGTPPT